MASHRKQTSDRLNPAEIAALRKDKGESIEWAERELNRLTPAEIESLRRDKKESLEWMGKELERQNNDSSEKSGTARNE